MPAPNPDSLKQTLNLSRQDILFGIARLPGTNRFFVGSSDFKVYETDLTQAKPEFTPLAAHASYVTSVAVAGSSVISGSYDGKLIWWDTTAGSAPRTKDAHARWIRKVVTAPGGQIVASVADDMICKLWDASSGKLIRELRGHAELTPQHFQSMLYTCAFTPDGKHLATADKVGKIIVWEVEGGKQVSTMEAPVMYTWDPVQRRHSIGGIRSLAFSPDGKTLAVGGTGKIGNIDHLEAKARLEVFDWQKGERTQEYPGDRSQGLINRLQFHPSGDWLLGAGGAGSGFLNIFDLASKKVLRQETVPMHVHDFHLNEAGDTIFAVGHNRVVVYAMKG